MKMVLSAAFTGLLLTAGLAAPASAAPCGGLGRGACSPLPCPSAPAPTVVGLPINDAVSAFFNAGFSNVAVVFYTGPLGTFTGETVGQNPAGGQFYPKCNQVLLTEKR